MLVARQGDVSRKLNQAFLYVESLNFNFVDKERSDIIEHQYTPFDYSPQTTKIPIIIMIIRGIHTEICLGAKA